MPAVLMTIVSIFGSMLMKLVSAAVIEKLTVLALEYLAKHSKSTVDDEVVQVVKSAIEGGK